MNGAGGRDEAERQAALLAGFAASTGAAAEALLVDAGIRERGDRLSRGLAAYRSQAAATAGRALANVFPTVQLMIGTGDFERLAVRFRQAHPPQRGDLGEWGVELPAFIEQQASLAAWPWLGDAARLDLAVHRSERAADATLDTESLCRLQTTDPALVRLELMPGSALLCSRWPIATIFAAHRPAPAGGCVDGAFEAARRAIAGGHGETVLVARQGWRAVVRAVDEAEAGWIRSLHDGASLETALRSAGIGFDFSAWLAGAVGMSTIRGVVLLEPP